MFFLAGFGHVLADDHFTIRSSPFDRLVFVFSASGYDIFKNLSRVTANNSISANPSLNNGNFIYVARLHTQT